MSRSPLILNLFVNCSSSLMNSVWKNRTLISNNCCSHRVQSQIGVLADLKSTLLLHDYILIAQKAVIRKALLCLHGASNSITELLYSKKYLALPWVCKVEKQNHAIDRSGSKFTVNCKRIGNLLHDFGCNWKIKNHTIGLIKIQFIILFNDKTWLTRT